MTTATGYILEDLPRTFDKLVKFHALRPIHSDEELEEALAILQPLVLGEGDNTKDQDDYMEALSILVEAYEKKHHAIPKGTPVDALWVLMHSHGMSAYELGKLLGDTSLGSKILRGERELSKSHIRKLMDYFGVSADVFIR